jgi:proline iminopeptidase
MTTLREFYPPIAPYHSDYLKVSELHTLYFEQVGNPQGAPILFLHGGPGGGISPDHRRYFDPKFYRIILFDQRGCGKSTPFAELKENTTWDLVSDIEKIRTHLRISKWIVFGGSWGSTLALSYAVTHTERVVGLILRGIFLCRKKEIQWFYQEGASRFFPDAWGPYFQFIPENERHDMVKAYYQRLTSDNEALRLKAAKLWSQWEMATSYLIPKASAVTEMEDPARALPFARIEAHYFIHNAFFESDNFLLEKANKLANLPVTIVQGRYDMVCPMESAYELHKAIPRSQLIIVPDCGHSASEPGIRSSLIEATDEFKKPPSSLDQGV